jgi:AcrR family transcriptional regulator
MTPEDRRAAIVDVALPLLREHGPALTTRQVAEAAGIAEGTVFRAFGSKDELVRACAAAVFDTEPTLERLAAIDRSLPLDERLVAGVAVLQRHVEQIVGLVSVLHHAGIHPPMDHGRRRGTSDPAVDAAFADLVGDDAATLRRPVEDVVGLLSLLTLSSVHPMLSTRRLEPVEIVDVVLDGTRRRT